MFDFRKFSVKKLRYKINLSQKGAYNGGANKIGRGAKRPEGEPTKVGGEAKRTEGEPILIV